MAIFYQVIDDVLLLGGQEWAGSLECSIDQWDFNTTENRSNIKHIRTHDNIKYYPDRTSLQYIFQHFRSLEDCDISTMITNTIVNVDRMFEGCTNLVSVTMSELNSNVSFIDSYGMFYNAGDNNKLIFNVPLNNIQYLEGIFRHSKYNQIIFSSLPQACVSLKSCFSDCYNLEYIDLTGITYGTQLNLIDFAVRCANLKEIILGDTLPESTTFQVSGWGWIHNSGKDTLSITGDLSKVNNLDHFASEVSAKALDFSNLVGISSTCTNISHMFYRSSIYALPDMTKWDFSGVRDIEGFTNLSNISVFDFAYADLSNVENWGNLASNDDYLEYFSITLNDNIGGTWDWKAILQNSSTNKHLIADIKVGSATDIQRLFRNCRCNKLTLFINDISNLTNISELFYRCYNLESIYTNINLADVEKTTNMFLDDNNLIGGNGTAYDSNYVDGSRALIDNDLNPGYFTAINTGYIIAYSIGYNGNFKTSNSGDELYNYVTIPYTGDITLINSDAHTPWYGWSIDNALNPSQAITIEVNTGEIVKAISEYNLTTTKNIQINVSVVGDGTYTYNPDTFTLGDIVSFECTPGEDNYFLRSEYTDADGLTTTIYNRTFNIYLTSYGNYNIKLFFSGSSNYNPYDPSTHVINLPSDIIQDDYPSDYLNKYSNLNLFKIFIPNDNQLSNFIGYLYSNTFIDALKSLWNRVVPFDELITSVMILPVSPKIDGTTTPKVGWISFAVGTEMNYTNTQYVDVDLGTLEVPRAWGNHLDYAPYSSISIYLPFIGERALDTDNVMGKQLKVIYKIDLLSGNCTASIIIDNSIHYQFTGQCGYVIPVSSNDMKNVSLSAIKSISSNIGIGAKAIGIATGNPGLMAVGSVMEQAKEEGESHSLIQMPSQISQSVQVSHIDNLSSNSGYMGVNYPYIIITRAIPDVSNNFGQLEGYPSNKSVVLGNLKGYTEILDVHLEGINATVDELNEIKNLLIGGVII